MSKRSSRKIERDSDSYSDVALDLDMDNPPDEAVEMELDELSGGKKQEEVEDSDDDQVRNDGNKLGVLYDMILTQDQIVEKLEPWDYKGFIQEFADEEAANDVPEDLSAIAAAVEIGDDQIESRS